MLVQMKEAIEDYQEENPSETQDTIDTRTTLQLQQAAMELKEDNVGTVCGDG